MNLEQKLESILFYKNEPLTFKNLSKLTENNEKEVREALSNLSTSLQGHGITLIMTDNEVSLVTAPESKDFIEKIAKDEMSNEIGKAGLETLAIVLYNGPISRREIDYVRGVNSTFILRNLCMRGLIEKVTNQNDQRVPKYKGSLSLLAHLGIKSFSELPQFKEIKQKLEETQNITENQDDK